LLLTAFIGCTAPPVPPVVVTVALWGPLGELAPTGSEPALASIAQPWVYDKLVTVDANGELKPILASRLERVSNQQVRIELRPDATFSDGAPVTDAASRQPQAHS